jgi:DDE superfamily endonuclease/putative transposase ISC1217
MLSLPQEARALLMNLSIAFTERTFQRILPLLVGAVLAKGRRTVLGVLWIMRGLVPGHFSDYHRVFSRAAWSLLPLGKVLARLVIELVHEARIVVAIDDTTARHKGKKVYGKGCHYDAVRSSHEHVAWKWGHKWVVLAILVRFPFARRPWALPVLAALYRPEELNRAEGRRHKTPAELARGLMALLMRWFPEKQFIFLGDGGYNSHELAEFCYRHRKQAALVSRFYADAALHDPPPVPRGKAAGRPRKKGRKRKSPEQVVAGSRLRKTKVRWYGARTRQVLVCHGTGQWYKGGHGLVPVRWVFVRDHDGTRRDEYFFTTDPTLTASQIVELYTWRWNIEVTFREIRDHLGFETTRQRVRLSVLRTAPCLLGLFSLVSLIYHDYRKHRTPQLAHRSGYEKTEPTFADAITSVRRLFWTKTIFQQPQWHAVFKKLPRSCAATLLEHLCQAA